MGLRNRISYNSCYFCPVVKCEFLEKSTDFKQIAERTPGRLWSAWVRYFFRIGIWSSTALDNDRKLGPSVLRQDAGSTYSDVPFRFFAGRFHALFRFIDYGHGNRRRFKAFII